MARTPVFSLVVRALRLAHYAERAGASAVEVVERWHSARASEREAEIGLLERPVTRRGFVRTGAVASTGLLLGGLSGCGARSSRRSATGLADGVLIVGAGLSGLVAARALREAGVRVRIMEAQNRVGGRVLSLRNFFRDGQVAELGGELIDTGHEVIRALASELEIELDDLAEDDPAGHSSVWFFDGGRQSEATVVQSFVPVASRLAADVAGLSPALTYALPGSALELDRLSIAGWLDREGVTGLARELIDVAYTTEYGLEIDEQSCLNLLFVLDPGGDPDRIFAESDERFHVRGGNDLIVTRLSEPLQDAIETTTVLEAIRLQGDGSLVCSFRRGASSIDVRASDVVLTIPFTMLREVRIDVPLPPVKQRAIGELGYGTNAKLMVGFAARLWRERWESNGSVLTDLGFQQTWETSRKQPGEAGILTNFTGGRHGVELGQGTTSSQAMLLVSKLLEVFPGISFTRTDTREARMHWPSHPFVRGSYACYKPGQWTALRGAEAEPVGRLYFAGEHCSLAAQGFMEGACETGLAAARQILAARGIQPGETRLSRRRLLMRR